MSNRPVIVAYGRSACCRARKGGWATTHIVDIAAETLKGVVAKVPQVKPEMIDDVITGAARHIYSTDSNVSRLIVLRAGFPESVPGMSVTRFCSSGLQTVATACNAIAAGQMKCVVAGGVEAMTATFGVGVPEEFRNKWILENSAGYMPMGMTAEKVARKYNITRPMMEQMALESHTKAAKARKEGWLQKSIIPIANAEGVVQYVDDGILAEADGTLKTSLEKMAGMKPSFGEQGLLTAATSSQTTDAAAYVMVMSEDFAKELGVTPIAVLTDFQVAGCDPSMMGLGPIYAVPKVLKRNNLTINDFDIIELNEAFASQALVCIDELKMPKEKVNPWGGAMALGHPMGATGAFLMCKALDYMKLNNGKRALITMCIGGGMGAAGVVELL